jgi:hypothetical protein
MALAKTVSGSDAVDREIEAMQQEAEEFCREIRSAGDGRSALRLPDRALRAGQKDAGGDGRDG